MPSPDDKNFPAFIFDHLMKRILLAITICLLTTAMVAQSVLAFRVNTTQSFITEEETHDEKPVKPLKKDLKESFLHHSDIAGNGISLKQLLKLNRQQYFFSKGYTEIPFTPPDFS